MAGDSTVLFHSSDNMNGVLSGDVSPAYLVTKKKSARPIDGGLQPVEEQRGNDTWCLEQAKLSTMADYFYQDLFASLGVDGHEYTVRSYFPVVP
ncbi:hypothetical protein V6N12_047321 [Hibiscus sabdariffa]|uniref:Uncharacterized protein n=1 Tax=Hibiscus sabdariffa TaxID=183260 RepID=A0ABR2DAJ3_9ROSI